MSVFRVRKVRLSVVIISVIFSIILLFAGMKIYIHTAYPLEYSEYVDKYATETDLPRSLVYAVIRTESGFDPEATSYLNAKGLMQIMPETLDWVRYRLGEKGEVSEDILYDAEKNIYYGCHLLRLLTDEFDTPREVMAAYHAGYGNVKKWLSDEEFSTDGVTIKHIPFNTTRKYVDKVMFTAEIYRKIYHLE